MDANAIVLELSMHADILNGDQKEISLNNDPTLQYQFIHACLKNTCTTEALTEVCDITIKVKCILKKSNFGEDTIRGLEKGTCCVDACMCLCVSVRVS